MTPDDTMVISATVVTDDPEKAARAGEVLSRASIGLVLDGITVMVSLSRADADPVDFHQDIEFGDPEDPDG